MTLELKFRWRQWLLSYLLSFVSFTGVLLAMIFARCLDLKTQGLAALSGIQWPANPKLDLILQVFWEIKIASLFWLLPLALAADMGIRHFIFKLDE